MGLGEGHIERGGALGERPRVLVSWGEAGNQENRGGYLHLCTEVLGVVTVEGCRHKQCVMSTMGCKLHFQQSSLPFSHAGLSGLCEAALKRLRVPRQESAVRTFRS